jgi:hypothetical protein
MKEAGVKVSDLTLFLLLAWNFCDMKMLAGTYGDFVFNLLAYFGG